MSYRMAILRIDFSLILFFCGLALCHSKSFGEGAIILKEVDGKKAFCRVFATGVGICDYGTMKECEARLNETVENGDEACLPRRNNMNMVKGNHGKTFQGCFNLEFDIVTNLGNHEYEAATSVHGSPLILRTIKTVFKSTGHAWMKAKSIGVRKVHLKNGFTEELHVYLECKNEEPMGMFK